MKKWLVGLVAAGLCAASAWADGDVLDRAATGVTGTSYQEWTVTGESGTKYAGQSAGGNESIQLRSTSPSGIVITESTGSDVASVTLAWNTEKTDSNRVVQVYGSATKYAGPADLYGDAKGTALGEIGVSETTLEVPAGYPFIGIRSKDKALYLTSVTIGFAGASGPSVSLSATATEVEIDEPVTITATAKNFSADVEWSWTGNGTADGATFTVDTSVAGTYEITATATAGEETASKSVTITVSEPAPKFTVSVNDGILNGTIELSVDDGEVVPGPIEVAAGATVKVVATPESGFKLASLEVETEGGQPVELSKSNTFEMPADNVWISASFEESTGGTATYTVTSKTAVEATGDVPEGSEAVYAADSTQVAQISSNKTAVLTLKGYEGMTITGLTLSMKSNKSAGSGSLSVTCGDAVLASIADSSFATGWSTAFSTEYVDVVPEVTATAIDGDVVITIAGSVNSLYCQSYTVEYETGGSSPLRVTLDQENPLRLDVGTGASVTATATGGEKPYTFAWECSTASELNGTDGTLAIPDTLGLGTYNVWLTVSDSSDPAREIMQAFVVVVQEPAVPHDVKIAVGMQGGVVTADPEKATVGEKVTLTATPADGKKLESMTVTYGEEGSKTTLTFTSSPAEFEMPDEDVYVGATFVEKPVVAGFTKITSLDELTEGEYVITGAKAAGEEYAMMASISDGKTAFLQRRETAVVLEEDVVTDAEDSIIWTLAQGADGWTIYNEAVGYAGYVASGNSSGAEAEPSAKSSWTITASETAGLFLLENVDTAGRYLLYNASSPRFACYTNLNSGKHLALYKGSSGPAPLRVSLDQENPLRLDVGTGASVTATATGGEKPYTFAWECSTAPELNGTGETLAIPDTLGLGTYNVWLTVSDSSDPAREIMQAFVVVVQEPAAKYAITVERVPGGVLSVEGDKTEAEAGETVKVTATADEGQKLVAITVTGDTTDLSFTSSPAEFEMPAEAVTVSAVFEEFEAPAVYITFEEGTYPTSYAATEAVVKNDGSLSDTIPTVKFAVEQTYRGNDANDKKVGDVALRMRAGTSGEFATNAVFGNAEAFAEAITSLSFQYARYGGDAAPTALKVQVSGDGETWDELTDLASSVTSSLQTYTCTEIPNGSVYFRILMTSSAKSFKRVNIDEIALEFGAAKPKISCEGETSMIMSGGTASFELQFSLANFDGDYTWAVTSGEGSIDASGVYTWTATESGEYPITVAAVSGEETIATKNVTLFAIDMTPPPGPGEVTLTCDPLSVTMEEGGSAEVTVTLDGMELGDYFIYFVDDISMYSQENPAVFHLAELGLSAGTYELTIAVGDGADEPIATTTLNVTVTSGGGSGGEEDIGEFSVDSKGGTLSFKEPSGAYTVKSTKDLVNGPWEDYPVTVEGGRVVIPMTDGPRYFRVGDPQ